MEMERNYEMLNDIVSSEFYAESISKWFEFRLEFIVLIFVLFTSGF